MFFGSIVGAMGQYNGMAAIPGAFGTVMYLLMALLYFFPVMYLFKFSTKLKEALESNNSQVLSESFTNLKSHYKFSILFQNKNQIDY